MSEVLLIQPIVGLLDKVKDKPAIPLSLLTAATHVSREYSVQIIDQRTDKAWRNTLTEALRRKPLCVGTTAMIGPQIGHALEAMKVVKTYGSAPTVWGGSQGGIMPHINIKNGLIDFVIQGDGEISFKMLVDSLAAGHSLERMQGIPGLHTRNMNHNEPWNLLDLTEQPDPPYHLVNVRDYLPKRFGKPTIDVETSRGCPFKCTFCYNPFLHGKWRALPADRVLTRVKDLHDQYGLDSFWFIDDEFFADLKRAQQIILGMKRFGFTWTVQGTTVANCLKMDDRYLKVLATSGCKQLNIGVESGSEVLLKQLRKPLRISDVLEVNHRLQRHNIIPSYYFVVGFPQETRDDFIKTLELAQRLLDENPQAKIMNIGCYTPYPNSELMSLCTVHGYKAPEELEGYIHYGVDEINTPWVLNNPHTHRKVRGANFCNYFLDKKIRDLEIPLYLRIPFELYRPIARWRFRHKKFGFPLDIHIGNWFKRRISR